MNANYLMMDVEELEQMVRVHSDWLCQAMEALAYKVDMENEWDSAVSAEDFAEMYAKKTGVCLY